MPTKKKPSKTHSALSLALQGGGTHGAFTWGVLDALLEDGRITLDGISAASTGAMNATILVHGMATGGVENARRQLEAFWHKVSVASSLLPVRPSLMDKWMGNTGMNFSPSFAALDFITRVFSPYEFNLFDINPLRDILDETVDFGRIRKQDDIRLFINATHVRTGRSKVFTGEELTLDMVLASACLPFIFQTVYVGDEPYWDGGYSGNPTLHPLIDDCETPDILIVQTHPTLIEDAPKRAPDILDRVNEISFNNSIMREMRAVDRITKLIDAGKLSPDEFKRAYLHCISGDDILAGLGRASKLNADWDFLTYLRDAGRQAAKDWLEAHFKHIGKRSTADVDALFL